MSPHPRIDIDVQSTLAALRGFQRDAVEHAFHRLYEAADSTRRFLIADEVGLGKTLIARGILARAIEHLDRTGVQRIDIVYVCSNRRIAVQNLRRLNPMKGQDVFPSVDRVTLLPINQISFEGRRLNFIAFTPGTSFDMGHSLGTARERLLLHALLESHWPVAGTGPLNLFQGNVGDTDRFRERARSFRSEHAISQSLERAFQLALEAEDASTPGSGRVGVRRQYEDLCERFHRARASLPDEDKRARAAFVSELRRLLARACIRSLEPDLVILDEFQRFKHLLEGDSDAAMLAKELFTYADEQSAVRVLLLSATPYKMYTLAHERDEDDHYADFLRTVGFLDEDKPRMAEFRDHLEGWRRELFRMSDRPSDALVAHKQSIETHLRRIMSRTERIRAAGDGSGMLREISGTDLELGANEVEGYVRLARIASEVETPGVIDYWKSAPFPLNFMEEYQLKKRILQRIDDADDDRLGPLLRAYQPWLLDWSLVEAYEPLPHGNARLRALISDLDQSGAFDLLWVPPTLPYWKLEGPFDQARRAGFTKRLVFSGWTVVPKAIATLLSYEVERRAFRRVDPGSRNTVEDRKGRRPLLRFGEAEGRKTGMPVIALLTPSLALARLGDPLDLDCRAEPGELSAADVLDRVAERIRPHLDRLTTEVERSGPEDDSWYWAAPILLDLALHQADADAFWGRTHLTRWWVGASKEEDAEDPDHDRSFADHLEQARAVVRGRVLLGRPPADLLPTLARIALAGPGSVCLRALAPPGQPASAEIRGAAARVAWGFRALFNRPESMAILRGADIKEAYWRRVLSYSSEGCLPAAVDEWAAVLRESLWLADSSTQEAADTVADAMVAALSLRAVNHDLHDIVGESSPVRYETRSLRAHFSLRFGSEKTDDEKTSQREGLVQGAFNSPFWPMVLATTSIGQEGLDFHPYCHSVLHWNLPSNPIDLEQREGRVNRYKNHAVRKNVAADHGRHALADPRSDLWGRMFDIALEAVEDEARGLIPHWIYPRASGAFIERHVPALPLSRDRTHQRNLRRSLAAYRLVFGQPRQDDLLEWLVSGRTTEELACASEALRVDLAPRGRSMGRTNGRVTDRQV